MVGPRRGVQINSERAVAGRAQSHALSPEWENRKGDRRELRNKMTQRAEASGEGNEFGQVPMKCCAAQRGEGMLQVVTVIKMSTSLHPVPWDNPLFSLNSITCDGCRCSSGGTSTLRLFTATIDVWILVTLFEPAGYIDATPSLEYEWREMKKALVVLTVFADQYPFMLLLSVRLDEVAPWMTLSFPFFLLSSTSCFNPFLAHCRGSLPAGRPTLSPSEQHWRTGGHRGKIMNRPQKYPAICPAVLFRFFHKMPPLFLGLSFQVSLSLSFFFF